MAHSGVFLAPSAQQATLQAACIHRGPSIHALSLCRPSFRLLNLRQPGVFVYLSASGAKGGALTPLATVLAPVAANVNEPTGVKLALTGHAGEVRVSWTSWNSSQVAVPRVKYGYGSDASPGVALAVTSSYGPGDLCPNADGTPSTAQGLGFLAPGELHSALLSQLAPSTRVFYAVGSDATGWSDTFSFTTPPPRGAAIRVLAASDIGVSDGDGSSGLVGTGLANGLAVGALSPFTTPASRVTASRLAREVGVNNRTLVLNAGGLSFAQGFGAQWSSADDVLQPITSAAPWMVALGNYEFDFTNNPHADGRLVGATVSDSGGECGVPGTLRFPMPWTNGPDAPWYSFDYGAMHVTVMSTEHPFELETPQFKWLSADLAAAAAARDAAMFDATNTTADAPRWLVFVGHRPFYVSSGVGSDVAIAQELSLYLEELWATHGVDITISGHHHSYQRSQPISYGMVQAACEGGSRDAAGTTHFVVGHGGAGPLGSLGGSEAGLMALANASAYGFVRLDVTATTLTVTAVASSDGSTMDKVVLTKAPGPRACFPILPGLDAGMPPLDKPTLITALVVCSIVAVGYGIRACMEKWEERSVEKHAHHATLALLEAREQAAREFAEEEKRMSEDMRMFSAEREEAQRKRAEDLRQQAQLARASGEFTERTTSQRPASPVQSSPPQSSGHTHKELPPLPPATQVYAPPAHVSGTEPAGGLAPPPPPPPPPVSSDTFGLL